MLATRGHPALVLQGAMSTTNRRAVVDRLDTANAGDGLLVIGTTPFIGEGFDAPALDGGSDAGRHIPRADRPVRPASALICRGINAARRAPAPTPREAR